MCHIDCTDTPNRSSNDLLLPNDLVLLEQV